MTSTPSHHNHFGFLLRSVKRVGRIWYRKKWTAYTFSSIKVTILVLYPLHHKWQYARPKSSRLSFLLPEQLQWEYTKVRSDLFLVIESILSWMVCMNGDVNLCTPCTNDIVRIHIMSWRVCVESFCRFEFSTTIQSTLVLLQERRHNRYLFGDTRFCLYRSI